MMDPADNEYLAVFRDGELWTNMQTAHEPRGRFKEGEFALVSVDESEGTASRVNAAEQRLALFNRGDAARPSAYWAADLTSVIASRTAFNPTEDVRLGSGLALIDSESVGGKSSVLGWMLQTMRDTGTKVYYLPVDEPDGFALDDPEGATVAMFNAAWRARRAGETVAVGIDAWATPFIGGTAGKGGVSRDPIIGLRSLSRQLDLMGLIGILLSNMSVESVQAQWAMLRGSVRTFFGIKSAARKATDMTNRQPGWHVTMSYSSRFPMDRGRAAIDITYVTPLDDFAALPIPDYAAVFGKPPEPKPRPKVVPPTSPDEVESERPRMRRRPPVPTEPGPNVPPATGDGGDASQVPFDSSEGVRLADLLSADDDDVDDEGVDDESDTDGNVADGVAGDNEDAAEDGEN